MSDAIASTAPSAAPPPAQPSAPLPLAQAAQVAINAEAAIMAAPDGSEPSWAKPAVAIASMVLFGAMIVVCIWTGNRDGLNLLVGSVITMATTAVSYYLGSSAGSARKTTMLASKSPQ